MEASHSKNTPASAVKPPEETHPLKSSQSQRPYMELATGPRQDQDLLTGRKGLPLDAKIHQLTQSAAAPKVSSATSVVSAALSIPARRQLFQTPPSHTPVRRTKSEGHVRVSLAEEPQSAVPEVCTDATMNDRLWSKLEAGSHRNSVSSSSSISSSDTVIDLSLPNLARKGLSGGRGDTPWVGGRRPVPVLPCEAQQVSKSKSNPDLKEGITDELRPRPLRPPVESSSESSGRLMQRRHTWSRLYMEGLKQSAASRPSPPAAVAATTASMSKSLGDLTSDDIACNFEGKYRSISRSFIVRPAREQLRRGSPQKNRPSDHLTEQLRQLTDVEPLTASDFDRANRASREAEEEEAAAVDESLVRRTSSRSQSRVRYIANRAKKAQERQRLQGLAQGRSASFSLTGLGGSPIEERGNPEGACCVFLPSPCTNLDLLSQLAPPGAPASPQLQSSPDSQNSQLFFRLKL